MAAVRQGARPLAGALGLANLGWRQHTTTCEEKPKAQFVQATCVKNQSHTHNVNKITLKLAADWTQNGAIANVVVKAGAVGVAEAGCCACCKCPQPCSCPKQANGCCACCKCPDTCGCPKKAAAKKAEEGCCACCKCPQPCGCPKQANGCCACCKCPGSCGCPKKEAPSATTVARPYNPLSVESGNTVTLLIKKYKDAKMGTKMHSLKEGDTVEVRGPNQQWKFEKYKYSHYAMVAGGTGVTPLIQAAEHILKNDSSRVTFLTFNKSPKDVLLQAELKALAARNPGRLTITHCVEGGAGYERGGRENMLDVLKAKLPAARDGVLVMVCGPKAMTECVAGPKTPDFKQGDVAGVLKDLGYEAKHVWKV